MFSNSRDVGIVVKVKDICTLSSAPGAEFRGDSPCDNQIGWEVNIFKVLPGCITADSKTLMGEHVTSNDITLP
jgi:hypothetical protein